MPFLDQIVLAASAIRRPGDTYDLLGSSWDTIPAPAVPVQQAGFALLLSLLLSPEEAQEEHEITLALMNPDGARIGKMTASVGAATAEQVASGERVRIETVLNATGVIYPEYGRYALAILWDGEPLREPLAIHVVPPDALPEASA